MGILILLLLIGWTVLAVRSQKKKPGGCSGNCAGCSGCSVSRR